MGRIRGREDNEYWQQTNREVFELFGNEDFKLWVLKQETYANADPVYGEPASGHAGYQFESFVVMGFIEEFVDDDIATELGLEIESTTLAWLNRRDMEDKGIVPHGPDHELASSGDVLEVYTEGEGHSYYDIVGADRKGYLNDTDRWSQLQLNLKRRDSFVPERKIENNC